MLGHELRNPLSPILTALQLMQLRAGDALREERAVIERQVRHMIRLVDDLLDVSRITRGKVELRKRRVELAEVVAKAIELASPLLEQRRHTLAVSVPARGLAVDGDEHRLAQILSNLLTNAARYTEPGGRVEVRGERRGGRAALSVRDTGVGIAPEMLPHIFDMFVQGERSFERSQGGLGLGLAIVRSLAQLHGGEVAARSEGPGRGSEFTVTLPLAPDDERTAPLPRVEAEVRVPGRRRVLVVDDNVDAAELLATALRLSGHDVRVAHDGPSALALAGDFPPEVAFLDLGLPVMDGFELGRRLRPLLAGRPLRIVAVSGYGQPVDRARSAEAGFDRHLVKPVDLAELLALTASAPRGA
jgi:CheY-like chemotaxis protein